MFASAPAKVRGGPSRAPLLAPGRQQNAPRPEYCNIPTTVCIPAASPASTKIMEFRQLGYSGLKVPVLSFGTRDFWRERRFLLALGATPMSQEATRLVDICLEAGLNFFDTADVYSNGASEEILGKAIAGRRDAVLISTKATFRMGDGPNDVGSSRYHLIQACEASLRRLDTDYIDVYHLHGFDALTPVEEALKTLDTLVHERQGALHRLLQLFRLAPDEVARAFPKDTAGRATSRIRPTIRWSDATSNGNSCRWHSIRKSATIVWSPLGWGATDGKDPAQPAEACGEPSAQSRRPRPAGCRMSISTKSWTRSTKWPAKPAKPFPRLPSTGSCNVPP